MMMNARAPPTAGRALIMLHLVASTAGALLSPEAAHVIAAGGVHRERNFVAGPLVAALRSRFGDYDWVPGESFSSNGRQDGLRHALTARPNVNDDTFYELYESLDDARLELSRGLGVDLSAGFEATFVVYPEGGFYRRHIDSVSGSDQPTAPRKISFIAYLNDDVPWAPSDGGALRCYDGAPPTASDESFVDVLPESGSLVLFDSKSVWHEVLPTRRERACLVGWFRT